MLNYEFWLIYKAASLSGFFPSHTTLSLAKKKETVDENGNPPLNFLFQMKSLVDVANITSALPPRCVASQPVRTHLYTNVIGHLLIDLLTYLLTYLLTSSSSSPSSSSGSC